MARESDRWYARLREFGLTLGLARASMHGVAPPASLWKNHDLSDFERPTTSPGPNAADQLASRYPRGGVAIFDKPVPVSFVRGPELPRHRFVERTLDQVLGDSGVLHRSVLHRSVKI